MKRFFVAPKIGVFQTKIFGRQFEQKKRSRLQIRGTYLQEVVMLFGMTLIFYIFYALLVYGSGPGFVNEMPTSVGFAGFILATLFLHLFGFMALAVPVTAFFLLMMWARNDFFVQVMPKLILYGFMLCGMMALLSGHVHSHQTFFFVSSGGVVGNFIYSWLATWCGHVGTTALLATFIWSASSILFGISLFAHLYGMMIIATKPIVAFFYGLVIIVDTLFNGAVKGVKLLFHSLIAWGKAIISFWTSYHIACTMLSRHCWEFCQSYRKTTINFHERNSETVQPAASVDKKDSMHRFEPPVTRRSWIDYPLRRTVERTWRGKYCFIKLPNSVVRRSMTALDESGMSFKQYVPPSFALFTPPAYDENAEQFVELCQERAHKLEEKLALFGINGKVVGICPGPVITLFEYRPESTSKISKIIALEDDLALALTAHSIRIIAPIPGRDVVGFEIANQERRVVRFSEILLSSAYEKQEYHLPLVLGVDVIGQPIVVDLIDMPHLLVGGTTGSGKSVGLNTMLMSLLCDKSPEQLRLILIDPKRLEFSPYADIAHLHFPIVTDANSASRVLTWLVQEMERRYELLAACGVRNVVDYERLREQDNFFKGKRLDRMPFMVLIIDELADLMMVAAKEVETSITRLAQMARAAGIHIIVATQRPSVDVVTGIIKVNFPSRISFRVSSKVDSRTIIDRSGAEKLLGKGDMLFMHATASALQRIHGCYLSQVDIERYTDALRMQAPPTYLNLDEEIKRTAQESDLRDELYDQVVQFIQTTGEISISLLQRQYRIGFNRSARIIEQLELDGLITPAQGSKPRKVIR